MERIATGKDIYCGIAILRPSVNREVRFGDDHHPADTTVRVERMKGISYNGSTCFPGRREEAVSEKAQIAQKLPIAILQF